MKWKAHDWDGIYRLVDKDLSDMRERRVVSDMRERRRISAFPPCPQCGARLLVNHTERRASGWVVRSLVCSNADCDFKRPDKRREYTDLRGR